MTGVLSVHFKFMMYSILFFNAAPLGLHIALACDGDAAL